MAHMNLVVLSSKKLQPLGHLQPAQVTRASTPSTGKIRESETSSGSTRLQSLAPVRARCFSSLRAVLNLFSNTGPPVGDVDPARHDVTKEVWCH